MALDPVRTEGTDYTGRQPADWHQPLRMQNVDQTHPFGKKVKMVQHIPDYNVVSAENATKFEWWRRGHETMEFAATDIYDDPGLSSATSTGSTAGQVKYIKCAANDARLYQTDEVVVITSTDSDVYGRIRAKVVDNAINGTSSYVTVRLLEADTGNILNDTTLYVGPAGPRNGAELREAGAARQRQYAKYYNYCQNWDYTVKASLKQLKENRFLDKFDPWAHYVQDEKDNFDMLREGMYFHGIRKEDEDGAYMTGGLRFWLDPTNSGTVSGRNLINYKTDSTYLGSDTGDIRSLGWDFFKNHAVYAKKWGGPGVLKCYTSSLVMKDIQTILEDLSLANRNVQDKQDQFGWYYTSLNCMGIEYQFYDHQEFSTTNGMARTIAMVRPEYLSRVVYSPEEYEDIDTSGKTYKAGWWKGSEGVRVDNPDAHFWVDAFGVDR